MCIQVPSAVFNHFSSNILNVAMHGYLKYFVKDEDEKCLFWLKNTDIHVHRRSQNSIWKICIMKKLNFKLFAPKVPFNYTLHGLFGGKKKIFICLKGAVAERDGEKERYPIPWVIPQMAAMASAEPG